MWVKIQPSLAGWMIYGSPTSGFPALTVPYEQGDTAETIIKHSLNWFQFKRF